MNTQHNIQQVRGQTYVFTVTDTENGKKPIVWAQSASDAHVKNQSLAEDLIRNWADTNEVMLDMFVADLAYDMRHDGFAWSGERFCFELTPVNG